MDDATRAAITSFGEILDRPDLGKAFTFERGQVQFVNNRRLGHRRDAYEDWPEPDPKAGSNGVCVRAPANPRRRRAGGPVGGY